MTGFWRGFEKQAINLYGSMQGLKALNRGNRPMQNITARPTSQQAVVGKVTPPPLPSATAARATTLPRSKLPESTKLKPNLQGGKGVTPSAV